MGTVSETNCSNMGWLCLWINHSQKVENDFLPSFFFFWSLSSFQNWISPSFYFSPWISTLTHESRQSKNQQGFHFQSVSGHILGLQPITSILMYFSFINSSITGWIAYHWPTHWAFEGLKPIYIRLVLYTFKKVLNASHHQNNNNEIQIKILI